HAPAGGVRESDRVGGGVRGFFRWWWSQSCRAPRERTNRDEILVPDRPDIGLLQRHQGLGSARCGHKLNLESIRFIDLDDSAEISTPQQVLGQVAIQNHSVELFGEELLTMVTAGQDYGASKGPARALRRRSAGGCRGWPGGVGSGGGPCRPGDSPVP